MTNEEAKEVHRSLRRGAGLLECAQGQWVQHLLQQPQPSSDIDPRVTTAYINQAQAEAQEGNFSPVFKINEFTKKYVTQNSFSYNQFIFD